MFLIRDGVQRHLVQLLASVKGHEIKSQTEQKQLFSIKYLVKKSRLSCYHIGNILVQSSTLKKLFDGNTFIACNFVLSKLN